MAVGSIGQPLFGAEPDEAVVGLSEHLFVYRGPIHVGILRDGERALLIDCGDARVADALTSLGITTVEQILFTHHHRDQACGAGILAARGARLAVPAAERDYFEKVADFWNDPKQRWHLYEYRPHHLMLTESVRVDRTLTDGQSLQWGPASIRAIATPGHTDGSMSYLVEVDGKTVLFSGDLIYDEGRIWDIYSLQMGYACDSRKPGRIMGYHAFLGARPMLAASLEKIKKLAPAMLVPSHGRIMSDPSKAIDALVERLAVCHENFAAVSSLRHYIPEAIAEFIGRPSQMPMAAVEPPPACLRQIGNTWVLISKEKAAFVLDCGSTKHIEAIQKLMADGEVKTVEGLWVTHYHDDHVDAIPEFQKTFDCPCITDHHVAQVITDPLAWRIPCISPSVARVDRITDEGDSWNWREFKMTAYFLPGQTLYHGALFVEGQGMRILFAGDSFSPGGIDDYCTYNRNWLGAGVGFDRCLELVEKLRPTHLINNHVANAFHFTPEQLRFMRANLAEREKLFGQLFPWDHANYGLDEPWVRCHPYEQQVTPARQVKLQVVVTNHSTCAHKLACRPVLPPRWFTDASLSSDPAAHWVRTEIPAKTEGQVELTLSVPANASAGRHVIPIDICFGPWTLPQFTEAVFVI